MSYDIVQVSGKASPLRVTTTLSLEEDILADVVAKLRRSGVDMKEEKDCFASIGIRKSKRVQDDKVNLARLWNFLTRYALHTWTYTYIFLYLDPLVILLSLLLDNLELRLT